MPDPTDYLGTHVRVWDAQHAGVFCMGRVIAVQTSPSIVIEDDAGVRHHHGVSLPIDILQWQPANHTADREAASDITVRVANPDPEPAPTVDPIFAQQKRALHLQTVADVIWHMSGPPFPGEELTSDHKRWLWAREVAEQVVLTEEAVARNG